MDLRAIALHRHGPCLHVGPRASAALRVILRLAEDDEVARAIDARERVGAATYDGAHVTLGWPDAFAAAAQEALDLLLYLTAEAGRHVDAPHVARQWVGLARAQHLLLLRMLDLADGGSRHHNAIVDRRELAGGFVQEAV
jgi:hypothetical protein